MRAGWGMLLTGVVLAGGGGGGGAPGADAPRAGGQTEAQLRANLAVMMQWNAYAAQRVAEPDLKKYYADTKDFFDKVTVRASHIVLRVAPDAPAAEREEAQKKLAALRQEV